MEIGAYAYRDRSIRLWQTAQSHVFWAEVVMTSDPRALEDVEDLMRSTPAGFRRRMLENFLEEEGKKIITESFAYTDADQFLQRVMSYGPVPADIILRIIEAGRRP